jgi:hypothetical protein
MSSHATDVIRLTRDELYERVWAEPMHTLAPRFGISDVALKKTCTRMRVPTPGRGYWAKRNAGAVVRRTPLPKLPASVPASMLTASFSRPPKLASDSEGEAPQDTGPVADQMRFEADLGHRISVTGVLTHPHLLVAASVHALRKAKSDAQHRLVPRSARCLSLSVTLGTVDRALCIMDALIKALDERGYTVEVTAAEQRDSSHAATSIRIGEERVGISLDERVDRVERPRDPKDKSLYYGKQYDYVPTGRLVFRIPQPYLGVRASWADGAKQRVEECLNDIIVGIVAAAEAMKARRLEQEARHREYLAAEERRQQAERKRQEEAARILALEASLVAWRRAAAIRQYIDAMRQAAEASGAVDEDSALAEWLRWAEGYANRVDPTKRTLEVPADPDPPRWAGYHVSSSNPPTGGSGPIW